MIKVKICGITRLEDGLLASELGAWAIGFIFVKASPRYIEPEKAAEIIKFLPENVQKIGVFANNFVDEILNFVNESKITQIQLHGDETPEFCTTLQEKTGLPIIKAFRIKNSSSLQAINPYKDTVSSILLDSYSEKELGGTGKSFDSDIAIEAKHFGMPIILAGGVNPDNIKNLVIKTVPYGVDISSGVESSKGIKDHNKLKELFFNING